MNGTQSVRAIKMWLVIFENGATHGVSAMDAVTAAEAIEISLSGIESISGLPREKLSKVVGCFNMGKLESLNKGLSLYQFRLEKGK